jgi:hypothetical protein
VALAQSESHTYITGPTKENTFCFQCSLATTVLLEPGPA